MPDKMQVKTCDQCGYATRDWRRITVLIDGRMAVEFTLCQAHTTDFVDNAKSEVTALTRG